MMLSRQEEGKDGLGNDSEDSFPGISSLGFGTDSIDKSDRKAEGFWSHKRPLGTSYTVFHLLRAIGIPDNP
jgi:hypothetical protein